MTVDKEKFFKYYDLDLSKLYKGVGIKNKSNDDDDFYFLYRNFKISLTYDIKDVNKDNVEEYVEKGLIDRVSLIDLLKDVTDLKEEDYEILFTNLDLRTKRYFDEISKEIGLEDTFYIKVGEVDGFEPVSDDEEAEIIKNVLSASNSEIDVLKSKDKYMVTSYEYSYIDDPSEVMQAYVFNKKPTPNSILTVDKMEMVKEMCRFRGFEFKETCPMCHKTLHWLDCEVEDGEIYQVLDRKIDKFLDDVFCECGA